MPTRRILEVSVLTVVLCKPIFGMLRLWAHRTLGSAQPSSIPHGIAEIVSVVT